MLFDSRSVAPGSVIETDVCIVGAGAAGITMALELIDAGFEVALVESGGLDFDDSTQALNAGVVAGLPYTPLERARVRYFGGTTNTWSGWCWPLDEIDFESRGWVPYSGWPFRRADLDAFYRRAHPICQLGPFEYTPAFWETNELKILPFEHGLIESRILRFSSPPTRFGEVYGSRLFQARNVSTYLHGSVVDIETNLEGTLVTALKVRCLTGNEFLTRARYYVVATGGIENARLLLASDRVQSTGLGNREGLVGRFFNDHPGLVHSLVLMADPNVNMSMYEIDREQASFLDEIDGGSMEKFLPDEASKRKLVAWLNEGAPSDLYAEQIRPILEESCTSCHSPDGVAFFRPLTSLEEVLHAISGGEENGRSRRPFVAAVTLSREAQRREEILNYRALLDVRGAWSDLVSGSLSEAVANIIANFADVATTAYRKVMKPSGRRKLYRLRSAIEPSPNPDSRVTLTADRDRLGMRRVRVDWRLTGHDRRTFERGERLVATELGRAGLGRMMIDLELDEGSWPEDLRHGWHHMGTTRMHDDPKQGVVDKDCRVHGIGNLFIAGSSVFPTYGYANPTLTIVALAIRLADHLKVLLR